MGQFSISANTLDSIKALSEIDFRNKLEEARIADAGLPRSANRFAPRCVCTFCYLVGCCHKAKTTCHATNWPRCIAAMPIIGTDATGPLLQHRQEMDPSTPELFAILKNHFAEHNHTIYALADIKYVTFLPTHFLHQLIRQANDLIAAAVTGINQC